MRFEAPRSFVRLSGAALAALACAPAAAQIAVCGGPVTSVFLDTDGTVLARFGGDGMVRLCSVNGSFAVHTGPSNTLPVTVTADMCTTLYSSILTARATGKHVRMYMHRPDCAFGDWAIPNPYPYTWEFPG